MGRLPPAMKSLAVEFGLTREFMLPLASGKLDPFIGIVGALSELQPGELGLVSSSVSAGAKSLGGKHRAIQSPTATANRFSSIRRNWLGAAENKVARPLYAAVVRILIRAGDFDRLLQLARDLAGSLRVFAHPSGNELIPLQQRRLPVSEDHIEDVLLRQTRRTGMMLNSDELIGFVHLPSSCRPFAGVSTADDQDQGGTGHCPPQQWLAAWQ